jgi:hypothetical protein
LSNFSRTYWLLGNSGLGSRRDSHLLCLRLLDFLGRHIDDRDEYVEMGKMFGDILQMMEVFDDGRIDLSQLSLGTCLHFKCDASHVVRRSRVR